MLLTGNYAGEYDLSHKCFHCHSFQTVYCIKTKAIPAVG